MTNNEFMKEIEEKQIELYNRLGKEVGCSIENAVSPLRSIMRTLIVSFTIIFIFTIITFGIISYNINMDTNECHNSPKKDIVWIVKDKVIYRDVNYKFGGPFKTRIIKNRKCEYYRTHHSDGAEYYTRCTSIK